MAMTDALTKSLVDNVGKMNLRSVFFLAIGESMLIICVGSKGGLYYEVRLDH
jgi:hypothetical protein